MQILDIFFTIFHTCLIIFILFGWIWKKTRRINLVCILLTACSWLFLGIKYGIGYCPLTDWHFQILKQLGYNNLPGSYVSFLINRLTGIRPDQGLVDMVTAIGLVFAMTASILVNFRGWFRRVVHLKQVTDHKK